MKITIEVEGLKYSVEMPNDTSFKEFMECNMDLVGSVYSDESVKKWLS